MLISRVGIAFMQKLFYCLFKSSRCKSRRVKSRSVDSFFFFSPLGAIQRRKLSRKKTNFKSIFNSTNQTMTVEPPMLVDFQVVLVSKHVSRWEMNFMTVNIPNIETPFLDSHTRHDNFCLTWISVELHKWSHFRGGD